MFALNLSVSSGSNIFTAVAIEVCTPTISTHGTNKKLNVGLGEASQARHRLGAPSVVVRCANCGLGYEREESLPTSN